MLGSPGFHPSIRYYVLTILMTQTNLLFLIAAFLYQQSLHSSVGFVFLQGLQGSKWIYELSLS